MAREESGGIESLEAKNRLNYAENPAGMMGSASLLTGFIRRIRAFSPSPSEMTSSATPSFDVYQLLCQHARSQPDAIAYTSRFRVATYRKLRNRIERSAARLHGEWGVRRGDLVAYLGCGHPDALVLYFGLVCCGARLLPLERRELQADSGRICAALGIRLVLTDDDFPPLADIASHTLSTLIGSVTPHPALAAAPDAGVVSLVRITQPLDDGMQLLQSSLADESRLPPASACEIRGALFDDVSFPRVLATLAGAGAVGFVS
jgi:acyl-CoA synthetase (AMP-forming)/AMP-acid ligase II